jgi:hypothetical protein
MEKEKQVNNKDVTKKQKINSRKIIVSSSPTQLTLEQIQKFKASADFIFDGRKPIRETLGSVLGELLVDEATEEE